MLAAGPSSSVRASAPQEVREAPRSGAAALCDERERMGWYLGERRCHATPRRAFGWLVPIVATGRRVRGVPGDPRIATRPHHPPARRGPVAPALESRDQQPLFALSRAAACASIAPPHARFATVRHALGSSTRERGWRERLTCRRRCGRRWRSLAYTHPFPLQRIAHTAARALRLPRLPRRARARAGWHRRGPRQFLRPHRRV